MPGGSPWSWQHGLVAGLRHRLDAAAAVLDADGRVVEAGPRLNIVFEGRAPPPIGRTLMELVCEPDRERASELCRQALVEGRPVEGVSLRLCQGGWTSLPLRVSLQPLGQNGALLSLDGPVTTAPSTGWAPAADPTGEERRRHLLQEHLAHRMHGPLAEVLGLCTLVVTSSHNATGSDPALLELLGHQIRHVMAIADDLSALAGEAVVTPTDRVSWLHIGHQLQRVAQSYLAPVGGRSQQAIHVTAPTPAWVLGHGERLRLLLSLLVEVELTTGYDAHLMCLPQHDGVELRIAVHTPAAGAGPEGNTGYVGDLTVVPLARGIAAAMGADLRMGVDENGRPMARCRLPREPGRAAPRVALWTEDPDLGDLSAALLRSAGVEPLRFDQAPTDGAGADTPDLVLVDVDGIEAQVDAVERARQSWPHSPLVALTSLDGLQRGPWAAVVRKPLGVQRLIELLGLLPPG